MNNEQQRRLDALEAATQEINCAEYDYHWNGEGARQPFTKGRWLDKDGEVCVIYDSEGDVELITGVNSEQRDNFRPYKPGEVPYSMLPVSTK